MGSLPASASWAQRRRLKADSLDLLSVCSGHPARFPIRGPYRLSMAAVNLGCWAPSRASLRYIREHAQDKAECGHYIRLGSKWGGGLSPISRSVACDSPLRPPDSAGKETTIANFLRQPTLSAQQLMWTPRNFDAGWVRREGRLGLD